MAHMGKSHLIIMFTVGPDDVAEGDRIFASHGEWMKGHPREGDAALLSYTISKGPELSNPLDPTTESGSTSIPFIGAQPPRLPPVWPVWLNSKP